jgi:hypothetical protein
MRASIEDWNNGWLEMELALSARDIDRLIRLLQLIKADPEQHFHASSDFIGTGGIGQITFCIQQPAEQDNLNLGGHALGAGDSVDTLP